MAEEKSGPALRMQSGRHLSYTGVCLKCSALDSPASPFTILNSFNEHNGFPSSLGLHYTLINALALNAKLLLLTLFLLY